MGGGPNPNDLPAKPQTHTPLKQQLLDDPSTTNHKRSIKRPHFNNPPQPRTQPQLVAARTDAELAELFRRTGEGLDDWERRVRSLPKAAGGVT